MEWGHFNAFLNFLHFLQVLHFIVYIYPKIPLEVIFIVQNNLLETLSLVVSKQHGYHKISRNLREGWEFTLCSHDRSWVCSQMPPHPQHLHPCAWLPVVTGSKRQLLWPRASESQPEALRGQVSLKELLLLPDSMSSRLQLK